MDGASSDDSGPPTTDRDLPAEGATPPAEESSPPDEDESGAEEPSFEIPDRPERRFTHAGGVEYEGGAAFHLEPAPEPPVGELESVLGRVFERDRYVPCDWFDFPRPVYLVHDREVSTAFRVVVRTGRLELHVLPSTESEGLRALYDGLTAATDHEWSVRCEVDPGA